MANIIDPTYFVGRISLPIDEIRNELTGNILRLEPEILDKSLGYDLKKSFMDGLAQVSPAQKWLDLRDGTDYQIGGIYYNWMGFANVRKQSIIANYVFCDYLVNGAWFNSAFGIRQINSENSVPVNHRGKQMQVYNEMIDWIASLDKFITNANLLDETTYPNYDPETIKKLFFF